MAPRIKNIENRLQSRKFFASLLLPNYRRFIESRNKHTSIRFYKAGLFFGRFHFGDFGSLATIQKGLASFVIYILKLLLPCQTTARVVSVHKVHALQSILSTGLRKPKWSNFSITEFPNPSRRGHFNAVRRQPSTAGATMLSKVGSHLYAALRASSKRSKKSITTDSPCQSWKRKAKAAFGRTRVPRPHRIFSPSRTIKSPRSFNPSLWPSLNGSPLCCA